MPDTIRTANRTSEIAEQVRAEAGRQRVSAARLSAQSGIGRVAMQRKMRGDSEFTATELERVADVLAVPVGTFYARPTNT